MVTALERQRQHQARLRHIFQGPMFLRRFVKASREERREIAVICLRGHYEEGEKRKKGTVWFEGGHDKDGGLGKEAIWHGTDLYVTTDHVLKLGTDTGPYIVERRFAYGKRVGNSDFAG